MLVSLVIARGTYYLRFRNQLVFFNEADFYRILTLLSLTSLISKGDSRRNLPQDECIDTCR